MDEVTPNEVLDTKMILHENFWNEDIILPKTGVSLTKIFTFYVGWARANWAPTA